MSIGRSTLRNRRILVIDDNSAIHQDFLKILGAPDAFDAALLADEAAIFGTPQREAFEIDTALQGEEGLRMVERAMAAGRPYAMAFVDVRMPPGWDGIETTRRIWQTCPDLQIVICTAYADCSWAEMQDQIQPGDRLLILKKPFDTIEVLQLANALTEKWQLLQDSKNRLDNLEELVKQRTAELEESRSAAVAMMEQAIRQRELVEKVCEDLKLQGCVLESMFEGVAICTEEGRIDHANAACGAMFGYAGPGMEGILLSSVLDGLPEQAGRIFNDPVEPADHGPWSGELKGRRKDGSSFITRVRASRLIFDTKRCLVVLIEDITAKKAMETQFLRALRMESVGRLSCGIAHDLNNILTPIMMAAYMLRQPSPAEETEKAISTIESSTQRGADLIKQLLSFGRGGSGSRTVVKVQRIVWDVEKIVRATFPKNITVEVNAEDSGWPVVCDVTQLHQVLLNLCVNARDAMPAGGSLTITLGNASLDENEAVLHSNAKAGPYLVLQVADTGEGIPPEIIDRVFDPFFTTKEAGSGTGLGLATVLGIVENHGGFIDLESTVGQGTVFKLFLPARPGAGEHAAEAPLAGSPGGNGETILVVDDERGIRDVTEKMLAGHGYKVLTAGDGSEAIAVYRRHRDEIKMVLTDLMMPGMDGVTMSGILKKMDPGIKIVASSGIGSVRSRDAKQKELQALGIHTLLLKPYRAEVVLGALGRELQTVPA
ncbi:MAG TPA: response regulator [Verrucomicrobiales bacterium]|jgi:PAS domain S-box-containing protein|nr:response regulator [Verrucomicrobiales bacterium]